MRKNSIKALSLMLSFLLVIPMLASLPFSVQAAETETVVGDFDGDGGLDNDDITALQAVLDGTQEVDVNEITKYDISGNRMVEFEDLVVLKNLVDPSQPALKDLLADGETEDILSLVNSTEGGVLQSAVVRGDSTKALEVNATGSVKVLFTAPQNWSRKTTLEMDTLWEKGSRTVTVILLGADGETVLGTAGDADSQEAGWSHVSVPLTGVTAQSRKEVGGFVINVAEDAHAYLDNLYLYLEPRDITTGVLTEDEKDALSTLTPEQYKAAAEDSAVKASGIVNWAYGEAGIDVSASFDQSVFNLMKKIFEGDAGARIPILYNSTIYNAKYGRMLVEGYYGGYEVADGVNKRFAAEDFQVGDVFCAISYEDPKNLQSAKSYRAGIYLGDGKFLMSGNTINSSSASIDSELVFSTTLAEDTGIYFVLRPEQLVPRDITSGVLTEKEKATLSALTVKRYTEAVEDTAVKASGIVNWAYGEAGVDVSASFDQSVFNLMKKIFEGDSKSGRTPISSDSASYEAKYSKMLVEGYYGGTEVKTADKLFTAADFQVGDIFCAVYYPDPNSTSKKYYAGIYLGDGEFLMSGNTMDTSSASINSELVFSTTLAEDMGIYFVLRPALLAPQEAPVDPIAPFDPDTIPKVEYGDITRSELEAALAEVAWDYYVKGVKVQYDSMDLNTRNDGHNEPLSKYSGGFWRTTTTSTLEDADSDTYLFTVCSDYAWNVYYETLGYPILGNRLNCHTSQLWRGTESPDDMVVLRWHNQEKDTYLSDYDDDYGMTFEDWYEFEDLKNFLTNWKANLRPGDIITQRTGNSAHAVLYVGNGMILHSNGEGKYNMVKGTDKPEAEGSISLSYVEDYYFTEGNIFNLDAMQRSSSQAWICVVRPLDILTKDDGDSDPANDVLDPDYVLDTGKLNAQLSIDPRPLQTSGYTIKDTTFTRMAYPGMDIDRTVDITPYGTVAKGGTLTYTIEISNRSTDPEYVAYRSYDQSEEYKGEAYEGLVIEEHVPENTVLVSAPGAYVEGGTLRWQVDIPQGESAVLTYTVKVTGEIGDKIVNGGGLVANIPSNTLTNVIGGAKLSEKALQNMDSFAQASKSEWNSNDGYKITAAMTAGTVFAERIYNETTGLDLQLPEIQELMDILFSYEAINVQNCLYLAHDSSGVTRYMYTLNETAADSDNQVYCDMVIDGYFGGVWAFSNDYAGEPRIYEFRTDYLEPGDIIIHTMLTPSNTDGAAEETRKVEEWNVVVYLGNDTFASLSSDGRLKKIQDDSAIMPGFSYDLFVALRPSQAYANINTKVAAFVGPAEDLTDEDMATVYKANISNVLLNDEKAAALAELNASDFSQHSGKFIGEVYSKIGLDVVNNGTMNSSYSTVVKALFADNSNNTTSETYLEYGHEYHLLEEPLVGTEKLYDMLMYYGGPAFATSEHITSLSDLHPGDAIMLGRGISALDEPTVNFGSMDVVAVYQGDGKFLVSIRDLAGTYYGTPDYREWTTKSFSSDAEFTAWLAAPIVDGNDDCFEGYVVLRPSRVFGNVNRVAYAGDNSIVEDDSEISSGRSITDQRLNNAEKLLIANLTVADWVEAGMPANLKAIPSWVYSKQLNITDISDYFDQTMFSLRNGLFYKSGSWFRLSDTSRANYVEKYHQMLVYERYGGFNFETSRILEESDFEIGDLFCAWTVDEYGKNIYWVGLYQGNYQFLLNRSGGYDGIKVTEEAYLTELNARISNSDYAFYFILRPEQLAPRNIKTGVLTDGEKAALSALTVEQYTAAGAANTKNQKIVTWAYGEAGIDVSDSFDQTVFNLTKAIFDVNNNVRTPIQPGADNYVAKYSEMLVEGYYGGTEIETADKLFTEADFRVGDVFCALYYPDPSSTDKSYYVGIYLGDGKFLMSQKVGDNWEATIDTELVFKTTLAEEMGTYFVLSPEQLVPRADGELTVAVQRKLSSLTEDDLTAQKKTNDTGIMNWLCDQYGITKLQKGVVKISTAIFNKPTTEYWTLLSSDSSNYNATCAKMLVDGYYGGIKFGAENSKTFTEADFKMGDIFCVQDSKSVVYVGLYQGEGQFLMAKNDGSGVAITGYLDTEMAFDKDIATNNNYYFVLRPSQYIYSTN